MFSKTTRDGQALKDLIVMLKEAMTKPDGGWEKDESLKRVGLPALPPVPQCQLFETNRRLRSPLDHIDVPHDRIIQRLQLLDTEYYCPGSHRDMVRCCTSALGGMSSSSLTSSASYPPSSSYRRQQPIKFHMSDRLTKKMIEPRFRLPRTVPTTRIR